MRRISIVSLLFALSFLNMGFTNPFQKSKEPEIKGIICGTDLYMKVLKDNFSKESIFSFEAEDKIYEEFKYIDDQYFYRYIVDINTGKLYTPDENSSNTLFTALKPFYQEKFDDVSYTYESEKKGNSIKILVNEYKNNSKVTSWDDDIDLKKLTNTFIDEGEKVSHTCIYFPIPGTIKIVS